MHSGSLSIIYPRTIALLLAVLFVAEVGTVPAAQSDPGGTNFDIPISELNKVKKKAPVKRGARKSAKKSDAAKPVESPSKTAAAAEPAGRTQIQPVVPGNLVPIEAPHTKLPAAAEQFQEAEKAQIHHSPYSFVVAGRRTVIHAVINSKAGIMEVNCILLETEGGAETQVKMENVNGTLFTYRATLPAQPKEGSSLRYKIVAVDSRGGKTRSQEFVTPVTSSPVVPSWQPETPGEAKPAEKGDGKKPLQEPSAPASSLKDPT